MENKVLFVISSNQSTSVRFLEHILDLMDFDKYECHVLSLSGDYENKLVKIRTLDESSFLDVKFSLGIKRCFKKKRWKYLSLLIKEKLLRKKDYKARKNIVKLEGRYSTCVCVDLEASAYVANNVIAKCKILRFPYSRVEEPFEEDFKATKKFNYVVCPDKNVVDDFAKIYAYDREKITVIPNEIFIKALEDKSNEYLVDKNTKYVITSFSRLTNNIDFVIDICDNLIKGGFDNFLWHIVSGLNDITKTKIKIKKAGFDKYINFLEKMPNPYPYLKACDVYAHISEIEGEIVALEEANALEKPSIVIDTNKKYSPVGKSCIKDSKVFAQNLIEMCQKPVKVNYKVNKTFVEKYTDLFYIEEENEEETTTSN